MTAYKPLIGGELVPGAMTSTVVNPATEDVLATAREVGDDTPFRCPIQHPAATLESRPRC